MKLLHARKMNLGLFIKRQIADHYPYQREVLGFQQLTLYNAFMSNSWQSRSKLFRYGSKFSLDGRMIRRKPHYTVKCKLCGKLSLEQHLVRHQRSRHCLHQRVDKKAIFIVEKPRIARINAYINATF